MSIITPKFASAMTQRDRDVLARGAINLIEDRHTLRALRKSERKTQIDLALAIGVSRAGVSQTENRRDMMLSTLGAYVAATGGRLRLVVERPGKAPVMLDGLDHEAG